MAASITGTFTIIDRASGPMRKMETQAKKTMAAIHGVGEATDKAGGSKGGAAQMEKQERAMRNVERSAKSTSTSLKGLGRESRDVDGRIGGLTQKLIKLGGVFTGLRAIMRVGMFATLAVGVTSLVQAVGALGGGLFALTPAVVSATGAIAAMPGVLAAAVQGFAGFKLALGGVGDALGAAIEMQKTSGQQATAMADQHRQAAEAIRNANNGVMLAARGVRNAEEGLTLAHRNQFDAQRALTDARREAIRELQDMQLAGKNAALAEERAALSLRQAKLSLSQRALDPTATSLDMLDSDLAVREAQLNLRQTRRDQKRAGQDRARVKRRGGVEGMPQVVDAMRGVEDAQRGIRDASEAVTDALFQQESAARALAEAHRSAAQAAKTGSAQADALKQSMKDLSPEAQKFVTFFASLRPRLLDLRAAAGENFFGPLTQGMRNLLTLQPMLERTFKRTGGVLGRGVKDITARMTTPGRTNDLEKMGEANNQILGRMMRSLGNLAEGFTDLMMAARPFTNWLAKTVEGWTEMWSETMAADRANGDLAERLDRTRTVLERFGRIISNVWDVLKALGEAARPLGERLWDGAEKATEGWEKYLESAEGAKKARQWFNDLYAPLHQLGQITSGIAGAWARLTVAPEFVKTLRIIRNMGPDLEQLFGKLSGLGPSVARLFRQMIRFLNQLPISPLELFIKALTKMMKFFNWAIENIPFVKELVTGAMIAMFGGSMLKLIGVFGRRMGGLIGVWGKLTKGIYAAIAASAAWSWMARRFPGLGLPLPGGGKAPGPATPGGPVIRTPTGRPPTPTGGPGGAAGKGVLGRIAGRALPIIGGAWLLDELGVFDNKSPEETDKQLSARRQINRQQGVGTQDVNTEGAVMQAARKAVEAVGGSEKQIRRIHRMMRDGTVDTWEDIRDKVDKIAGNVRDRAAKRYDEMRDDVQRKSKQIITGTDSNFERVRSIIGKKTFEAKREAGTNFQALRDEAIKNLIGMGFSPTEAAATIAGKGPNSSAAAPSQLGPGANTRAYGGRLAGGGRLHGIGLHDNVALGGNTRGAPGELVVNRHTERKINQKLGGKTTLGAEVGREGTPHYAKKSWLTRHAKGGILEPPGDPGSEVVQAAYAGTVGKFLARFGMDLTQGYAPNGPSVSAGHNLLSAAPSLDVVPADGNWDGAFAQGLKWALSQGMQVGYDGQYGTQAWDDHGEGNHAHIDWSGGANMKIKGGVPPIAGGSVAQKMKALTAPTSRMSGVLGAMVTRVGANQAKAMTASINKGLGAATTGTAGGLYRGPLNRNFGRGDMTRIAPTDAAMLAEKAGLPGVTFAQIAKGESSFIPGAVGNDPGGPPSSSRSAVDAGGLWNSTLCTCMTQPPRRFRRRRRRGLGQREQFTREA